METKEAPDKPVPSKPAQALQKVLGQSEEVKDLVEECAEELSSVNLDIKQELSARDLPPVVGEAIDKSEIIEQKVQAASEKLADVNMALEVEIQERHLLEKQLAIMTEQKDAANFSAAHDTLTGLPNRPLFNDRLRQALAQAKRYGSNVAVMFVDLDDFKIVNDTHGHAAGDRILQIVAERLRAITRADDSISRLGGDEFLFLLRSPGSDAEVVGIVEKFLASLRQPCQVEVGDARQSISINASLGIALFPKNGDTADTLIANADKAMYEAKRNKSSYAFAAT